MYSEFTHVGNKYTDISVLIKENIYMLRVEYK